MKHLSFARTLSACIAILASAAGCASSDEDGYVVAGQALDGNLSSAALPASFGGIERGTILVNQPNRTTWHTAKVNHNYANPVVVMDPPSYDGPDPLAGVRMRKIGASQFEFKLDEWAYLDGVHAAERLTYAVMEAGVQVLPNGMKLQAGRRAGVTDQWQTVTFPEAFVLVPVVVAQCATNNGPDPVVTRLRNITNTGFEVALFEEEAADGVHTNETIHWIAVPPRSNTPAAPFAVVRTPVAVTQDWYQMSIPTQTSQALVVARIQTFNGPDPAGLRTRNPQPNSIELFIEEENSKDVEIEHTAEAVGALAFALVGATCRASVDCGASYACCDDDSAAICRGTDSSCSCHATCN